MSPIDYKHQTQEQLLILSHRISNYKLQEAPNQLATHADNELWTKSNLCLGFSHYKGDNYLVRVDRYLTGRLLKGPPEVPLAKEIIGIAHELSSKGDLYISEALWC